MKHILLSCHSIRNIGGIATSITNLLSNISNNYKIDICVLTGHIGDKIVLPPNVTVLPYSPSFSDMFADRGVFQSYNVIRRIVAYVRRIYKRIVGNELAIKTCLLFYKNNIQYDAAIAYYDDSYRDGRLIVGGDYDLILRCVSAKKKIAWIHNDPNEIGHTREKDLKVYKNFDAIVNVSYDCKNKFDRIVPEYKQKSFVVYNTYNINLIHTLSNTSNPYRLSNLHFVTVCRISELQKKISRIINVVDKLTQEGYSGFDWTLVGDGPERPKFENDVKNRGLQDVICFTGLKKNPYPYMKHADAFVLVSEFEGFGMTIREAQIVGTPTYVTNFGPAHEAVLDGKQGFVCDNSEEGVYFMIKQLLDNHSLIINHRKYIAENPITNELALQQFDMVIK